MRNGKRIHEVKIKHMIDESPDTSHLGEYSAKPTSEFSIDRAHSLDCVLNNARPTEAIQQLGRILDYLDEITSDDGLADACDIVVTAQNELTECNCGEHGDMGRNEFRYFNPSRNYVEVNGKPVEGNSPADVRKYVLQDYARMESLNAGDWSYVGVRAETEISVSRNEKPDSGYLLQTIESGGLWGIESDSDASYIKEVEQQELSELKDQLHALGFSKRAISAAFREVSNVR